MSTKDQRNFQYTSQDFEFVVKDGNDQSEFDMSLQNKWEEAKKANIFRYQLNISEWKRLDGKYKFLAQLNVDRAQNRRAPQNITTMNAEFDEKSFNFTKIPEKEIFFDVGNGDGDNVIAANISPFEDGHFLFVPERFQCLPQKVSESSLIKIIELFLLSKSPFLRAVFNSLCAYASVNHLHWHLYYLKHKMMLEDIPIECLAGPLYTLKDYPAKGFCIKLSSFHEKDIYSFASWAFLIINYLQENSIAHNVYITRAKGSPNDSMYNDIRIYIWARKSSTGIKDTTAFNPAVCEFFGHLSIKSEEAYKTLTEKQVEEFLIDVTSETFKDVKEQLKMFVNNRIN